MSENEDPTTRPEALSPPLELPHALGVSRLVLSRGNLFMVTGGAGNIVPAGARELGMFWEDTRHLSYYELILPGHPPTLLSSETESCLASQIDLTTTDEEFGGLLGEPINVLHLRRRQLLDGDFIEHIALTNHMGRFIELEFHVAFAADFADVFEVRGARRAGRGQILEPQVRSDRVQLGYRGLDGETYATSLQFHPPPEHVDAGAARFRVVLPPGATHIVEVSVRCWRGTPPSPRPRRSFATRLSVVRGEVGHFLGDCTRVRCDNELVQRGMERSLGDVSALRILHDARWVVGAGIPWFAAPFGRDSLITSAQVLAFAPHIAAETLRFLAAHQGTVHNAYREEEPGKIMHELRRGELVRTGEIPHAPYFGTVDATPLFLVLVGEYLQWSGDVGLVDELWPAIEAAVGWLDRSTSDGADFLRYQRVSPRGLDNQGWKDSRDGVPFPDGANAASPIALVEVQGYAVDAWRQVARLALLRGDTERARMWRERSEGFAVALERSFWCEELNYYALAIDGNGHRVPTVTSNPGHLLWSRAVTEDRARRITNTLLSHEMYTGWAIRTLARGQRVYNPLSYHNGSVWPHDNAIAAMGMSRYGLGRSAQKVFAGLLAATDHFHHQRLPELFCGMDRGEREFLVHYPVSCSPQAWASGALLMAMQAVLGLQPDALAGRLAIRNPRLPPSVSRLDLLDMRVGAARVDLRFIRSDNHTHAEVLDIRDGAVKVEIEVSPGMRE
ncbi:MAG: glycogen debranching N-terminal domain-containing protein [Pseudomonadota bacterium]|nr:glycogen debranching N-terminal domain-containing protein [Pseudomonadota bacterium]